MKTLWSGLVILLLTTGFAAGGAMAQGPAGAGAGVAAGGGSTTSHSYNPTKWFGKKNARQDTESSAAIEELDKKLEPRLREAQVLAANSSLKDVCVNFVLRLDCVAALHASHNLGLNFECVKSNVTGVRAGMDATSCRMPADDKPLSLMKTIHLLKSDANAKSAAKDSEAAAREDLRASGS